MHVSEFEMWELTGRQRVKVHLSRATEKALHRLGCIVGKTLGLYAAPCLQAQSKLCTQCREMTFALECTHIPQGQQPAASTPLGGWVQNGRGLTLKKKKKALHQILRNKWSGTLWGGWGAVHTTGWMESNYPALPLGRFPAFRSFLPWRYSTVFPWPPGNQGLVRTVKSSHKSEPQSLVPKRRYSSAWKGSDISGAQSVSREDVTTWRNRPMESELRVWHQLRGLGSSSGDKHPYFHLDRKNHSKSINQLFNLYIPCNQHCTMLESEGWIQRNITHGPWSQRSTI